MEVEKALDKLGTFGKWQIKNTFLISIFFGLLPAWHMLAIVWIAHTPEHHCRVSVGVSINDSIPRDSNGKLSQCLKYVNLSLSNQTMACDQGWTYDLQDSYTIVNQWDLVCDNEFYSQLPQTIMVLGVMVGAFISSVISDRFGRKPVFIVGQLGMVVVGVSCCFVTNYYVFLLFKFFTGTLHQTILLSSFILISELLSTRLRTFVGINVQCFWGFFAGLLAILAYLIPHWVHLQLIISLSGLFSIPLIWAISESVPWLYANGRVDEAEKTIKDAAEMNKIPMPDVILVRNHDILLDETSLKKEKMTEKIKSIFQAKKSLSHHYSTEYTLVDLMKSRKLMLYLSITSFMWIVITLVYYGLSLTTGEMEGNRFLNGFFNGVIEIPAYIASYALITKFGRKKPLFFLFFFAAISLLLTLFVPKNQDLSYISNILSISGKFCITGCFGILFLYVSEMFPTNLRNQAIGISSFFGRIGNISATFAKILMIRYPALPVVIFAGFSFAAGLSVLLLPETKNRSLPNTIEEIESWKINEVIMKKSQKDESILLPSDLESKENQTELA